MKLTEKQKKEIDLLFDTIKDKNKLLSELDKYKFDDGSWSLYIRWKLDSWELYG